MNALNAGATLSRVFVTSCATSQRELDNTHFSLQIRPLQIIGGLSICQAFTFSPTQNRESEHGGQYAAHKVLKMRTRDLPAAQRHWRVTSVTRNLTSLFVFGASKVHNIP